MSRNIVTKDDIQRRSGGAGAFPSATAGGSGQPPPPPPLDDYPTKLMKYIPAEVVTLYVALEAIVQSANPGTGTETAQWLIFIVGLVATPLYLWKQGKVDKPLQLIISTVAFCVWVFALGGPFVGMEWYVANPLIPALVLPIYTFMVGLVDP